MPSKHDQIREIFFGALEIGSPDERAAYLDKACADKPEIRCRLDALILAHERPESLLDKVALDVNGSGGDTAAEPHIAERLGDRIGPYKLVEQIGEGGFGIVYLAEQHEPVRRQVALKIIKPGMDTREVIARFEAERQALALMDHAGIARVLDAGATESGRPYFVMELVRGIPITNYCDQCNLTTEDRLRLFIDVCHAVQHAHQKGIIHRDLKPTNVLVAIQDGQPAVKVIDFGVAKAINQRLTEHTLMTGLSQLIGTPLYMSPEQAEMGPLDIDTRSDIYSLGVLLYELLTGSTPFVRERLKGASFDELRRIIQEEEPPTPSTRLSTLDAAAISTIAEHRRTDSRRLRQAVRGDLDWIVMKALDKDRTRRYETAGAFTRDVRRFLGQIPVEACPPSAGYRLRKFVRRNRFALVSASTIAVFLLAATIVSAWQAVRATQAEQLAQDRLETETRALRAETKARTDAENAISLATRQEELARKQRDLTLQNLYVAQLRLAHEDWKAGNLSRMLRTLDGHLPRQDLPDQRGWEWYYLASLPRKRTNVVEPELGSINDVGWSPDGKLVAIAGRRGTKIYEPISQQVVHHFPGHTRATWSADGSRLATVISEQEKQQIKIWTTDTWQEIHTLPPGGRVGPLAWKANSRGLAWASGTRFAYWDEGQREPAPMRQPAKDGFGIRGAAWGPEDRLLVLGGAFPSLVVIWDTAESKPVAEFDTGDHDTTQRGTTNIAMSPKGDRFATASIDGDIAVWSLPSGELIHAFVANQGLISACAWSPDGKQLVSAGEDNLVWIWNAETGQQVNMFPGHRALVRSVDWSPMQNWIVSGAADGTVRFWRPEESQDALLRPARGDIAWSPDGDQIVSNDPRRKGIVGFSILDSHTGQPVRRLQNQLHGSMHVFAWSPNGKMIAGAGFHGAAYVWEASTGRLLHSIPRAHIPQNAGHGETRCVAWSPDNRYFATCGQDGLIRVWQTSDATLVHTFDDHRAALGSVCWSPNGRWFASADWRRDIKIRATDTWQIAWEIDGRPALTGPGAGGDHTIAWSPDSQRLAAVNASGEIVAWRLSRDKKPQQLWAVEAHTSVIRSVAWSPDGRRIASGSEDRTAKIFDAADGRELLTLGGHRGHVKSVEWSPDGRRFASSTGDTQFVHIWDATEAYESLSSADTAKRRDFPEDEEATMAESPAPSR